MLSYERDFVSPNPFKGLESQPRVPQHVTAATVLLVHFKSMFLILSKDSMK
jgi:hypothetical protein